MRLVLGPGLAPELRAALVPVAARLTAPDLAALHPRAVAFAGTPDPIALARADGPVVAVPVDDASRAPEAAVLAHAGAVALLDPGDLPDAIGERPVVVTGMPAPPPSGTDAPLDPGRGTRGLQEALAAELAEGAHAPGSGGVTWAGGRGATLLARARAAWLAGRAVVALPGAGESAELEAAGCPRADTALAALEVTRVLLESPPLTRMLAGAGAHAAVHAPTAEAVAAGLLEAAEVARAARPARA